MDMDMDIEELSREIGLPEKAANTGYALPPPPTPTAAGTMTLPPLPGSSIIDDSVYEDIDPNILREIEQPGYFDDLIATATTSVDNAASAATDTTISNIKNKTPWFSTDWSVATKKDSLLDGVTHFGITPKTQLQGIETGLVDMLQTRVFVLDGHGGVLVPTEQINLASDITAEDNQHIKIITYVKMGQCYKDPDTTKGAFKASICSNPASPFSDISNPLYQGVSALPAASGSFANTWSHPIEENKEIHINNISELLFTKLDDGSSFAGRPSGVWECDKGILDNKVIDFDRIAPPDGIAWRLSSILQYLKEFVHGASFELHIIACLVPMDKNLQIIDHD